MKSLQIFFSAFLFVSLLFFNSCKKESPSEPEEPIPQELNANTTYTGNIGVRGEIDRFLYKPTINHYIHIACTEAVQYSEFNPHIRLLDYTTKHLLAEATSYTQAVITNFYVKSGKIYEGHVREWSDDQTGGYTLLIEIDNDDEKVLIKDRNINGKINYIKDIDDFILNVSEIGYYHISVKEKVPFSDFNPHVSLLDFATKYRLDQQTSQTEAVLVNKNLGQNPSYWIRVQEWSDDRPGEYVITYMKDPDDSVTFASTPVYYIGKIDFVKDKDKFYFRPNANGNYKITLSERIPNSEYNPHLRVFGEYGNVLRTKAAVDSAVINISFEAAKLYGIEASEWSDDQPGEYILKIEMQ